MRLSRFCLLAFAAMLLLGARPAGADLVFTDSAFADADWSHVQLAEEFGPGTISAGQQLAGGNPGSFRQITGTDTSGNGWFVAAISLRDGAVYNPSVQGELLGVDFSFDYSRRAGSDTLLANLVLMQDGIYYMPAVGGLPTPYSAGNEWNTLSETGLTSGDFLRLVGPGPINPDFSSTGGEIQFGYFTDFWLNPNQSASAGVDNWTVTAVTAASATPEPGSMALFGAGVLGLVAVRRKRRGAAATEAGSEE